ncbi:MAG: D-alanine--D-alanine ligase [Clostridiales bacterium]|nr:D-alanine--D-alanine ligase [Clostridiales bacterium]
MIAVFFGGRSCEHDISVITGLQAMSACKKKCVGVYIDADGVWWAAECFDSVSAVRNNRFDGKRVYLRPAENYLYHKNKKLYKVDCALLCMHGILGEDGSLQGLLEMCGIPYTGSGVMASAIGMNKIKSKQAFVGAGLNVLPYVTATHVNYNADAGAVLESAESLGYPVIVKPCNLGSSIGISIAEDRAQLYTALRVAFEWDDVVIIEKALLDFTEVNCAVLGDSYDRDLIVSQTEQPVGWKTFLTFADKYAGDVKSLRHKMPAEIGAEKNELVQSLAEKAFRAVGCSGVARVDFMIKCDDIYVNEINTIPGSLSSPLFSEQMPFSKLIDKLIECAVDRKQRFDALKRTYTPTIPIVGK